jgi:hypothetical protein
LASEAVTPGGKCRGRRKGPTSNSDGGKGRLATPRLNVWPTTIGSASRASATVARRFRVTLRHVVRVHLQLRHPDSSQARLQHSLTMAKFDGTREKRGSHDGLYAARVYRQDRRRLLRRLRRSSGCSPVRSCRISGFGGCTRPCRGAWPNGIASGAGIFPEAEEQQSHHGLYAAKVYRNDRRRLLRRLR